MVSLFLIFSADTYMLFTYGQDVLLLNMMTMHEPMVFDVHWSLPAWFYKKYINENFLSIHNAIEA